MTTLTIRVRDKSVLKLIEDLEALNLIQIVQDNVEPHSKRLSEKLFGCISEEQADEMRKACRR